MNRAKMVCQWRERGCSDGGGVRVKCHVSTFETEFSVNEK